MLMMLSCPVVGIFRENASLEAARPRGRPGRNGDLMKRGRRHCRSPHSKARAVGLRQQCRGLARLKGFAAAADLGQGLGVGTERSGGAKRGWACIGLECTNKLNRERWALSVWRGKKGWACFG